MITNIHSTSGRRKAWTMLQRTKTLLVMGGACLFFAALWNVWNLIGGNVPETRAVLLWKNLSGAGQIVVTTPTISRSWDVLLAPILAFLVMGLIEKWRRVGEDELLIASCLLGGGLIVGLTLGLAVPAGLLSILGIGSVLGLAGVTFVFLLWNRDIHLPGSLALPVGLSLGLGLVYGLAIGLVVFVCQVVPVLVMVSFIFSFRLVLREPKTASEEGVLANISKGEAVKAG